MYIKEHVKDCQDPFLVKKIPTDFDSYKKLVRLWVALQVDLISFLQVFYTFLIRFFQVSNTQTLWDYPRKD